MYEIKTEADDGGYRQAEHISDLQDIICVNIKSDEMKCESSEGLVSALMNTVITGAGVDHKDQTEPWQYTGGPMLTQRSNLNPHCDVINGNKHVQDLSRAPTPLVPTGEDSEESTGPDGQLGYQHVTRLASALVDLRGLDWVSDAKVDKLVCLWSALPDADKSRLVCPSRHQERLVKGRFKATKSKTSVVAGKENLQHCLLGQASGPAIWPSTSRLVEAICSQLCRLHPTGYTSRGVRRTRWAAVLTDYTHIRELVLDNPRLMARTALQLFELNQRTLSQWFSRRQKEWERTVLEQAVVAPSTPAVASQPLPRQLLRGDEASGQPPFVFITPEDRSRQATQHRRIAHVPILPSSGVPAQLDTAAPPPVPRTTAWRRRKEAERAGAGGAIPPKRRNPVEYICARCKQPKRREFGHSRFGKVSFCATAVGRSVEEWLAEMKGAQERSVQEDAQEQSAQEDAQEQSAQEDAQEQSAQEDAQEQSAQEDAQEQSAQEDAQEQSAQEDAQERSAQEDADPPAGRRTPYPCK
ncbi:uncharacterized protein LOC118220428 [Anguilla anguilla]|uniref:uncharacterized protein LOC118220428 n=1 Tax=Anguilla anguilla TaxID=7936 RepID=UPI0015B18448|nr:uncharacterized protein LOC118220428 [Anguilla anguilla]